MSIYESWQCIYTLMKDHYVQSGPGLLKGGRNQSSLCEKGKARIIECRLLDSSRQRISYLLSLVRGHQSCMPATNTTMLIIVSSLTEYYDYSHEHRDHEKTSSSSSLILMLVLLDVCSLVNRGTSNHLLLLS